MRAAASRFTRSALRTAALISALTGAALTLGCLGEGGPGYSADRFTYISNEWRPWTVSLIDTRTGETIWTVDVPVGQQLAVGFRPGTGPNEIRPDLMEWGLMPAGRRGGSLPNVVPVPDRFSRRLETTLRPAPEMPTPEIHSSAE